MEKTLVEIQSPSSHSPSHTLSFSPSPATPWRHPLVAKAPRVNKLDRFAESAGSTAAECTAICCCFPFGLVTLLVAFVVKLPAGLVRRAVSGRSRRKKRGYLHGNGQCCRNISDSFDDEDLRLYRGVLLARASSNESWSSTSSQTFKEVSELEREMMESFYSASSGFWRSPSQKE